MTCNRCGCEGIHACIGFQPPPWTDRERDQLRSTMQKIASSVEAKARELYTCTTQGNSCSVRREVCAKRARKLRKRGVFTVYVGRTTTGKTRYAWMKQISPWAIYKA